MDCPWTVHGLSMDSPWTVHGLSMDSPRTVHGQSMDSPWTVHGQPMVQVRSPDKNNQTETDIPHRGGGGGSDPFGEKQKKLIKN